MNKRILIAGFACLSLFAAAQSSDKQQKASTTKQVTAPRDIATGQASGRKMNQKAESDGIVHRDVAARESSAPSVSEIRESPSKGSAALRESPTKASTGKTSVRESSSPSESENSQAATPSGVMVRESPSKASLGRTSIKVDGNANHVATGDVNGDGKADLTWSPRSNKAQVATGDVDGDGTLDATVNKNSGHATEQSAINSSHSNIKNQREAATGQGSGKRQQADTKK
jgi:hypothetical protein